MRGGPPVRDVSDIAPAVSALLPAPWQRYYLRSEQVRQAQVANATSGYGPNLFLSGVLKTPDEMIAASQQQIAVQRATLAVPSGLTTRFFVISHRLRVVTEPQVRAAPNHQLRMADAGPEADSLLALLLANDQFSKFMALADTSKPPFESKLLTAMDRCTIHGTLDFDHHFVSVRVMYADASGLQQGDLSFNVGAGIISRENSNQR
jgi:hypothetical protein